VRTVANENNACQQRPSFTLVELLVALAIVALVLSVVTPRYFGSDNLRILREMINKHHADHGAYPQ
jgi:general secretion pathway protein G